MNFLKNFFSTSNEINENSVMGFSSFIVAVVLAVVKVWAHEVPNELIYLFLGYSAGCFGIGAFKK